PSLCRVVVIVQHWSVEVIVPRRKETDERKAFADRALFKAEEMILSGEPHSLHHATKFLMNAANGPSGKISIEETKAQAQLLHPTAASDRADVSTVAHPVPDDSQSDRTQLIVDKKELLRICKTIMPNGAKSGV